MYLRLIIALPTRNKGNLHKYTSVLTAYLVSHTLVSGRLYASKVVCN